MKKILPNFITTLRMAGTLCLLFIRPLSAVFFVIYTLTGLTDVLDGFVARRTNTTTEFGATLDSIADLFFYSVMLLRVFPVLYQKLPLKIWIAVSIIIFIRILSYITSALKYGRFASLHTYLNKLTGAAVFSVPYIIGLPIAVPICWVICAIAAISSSEELLIHIFKKHHEDTKTIIEKGI